MNRLFALTFAFTALFAVAASAATPAVEVDATAQALANTPEAALQLAWDTAEDGLAAKCARIGAASGGAEVGTDQVAPVSNGFLAEVHAGGHCL